MLLKSSDDRVSDAVLAIRGIRMSMIYSDLTLSRISVGKEFFETGSAIQQPILVDESLQSAHDEMIAKSKLTLILR